MVSYWLSSWPLRASHRLEFISGSRWSMLSHPFSTDQWAPSHLWCALKHWQAIFLLQTQRHILQTQQQVITQCTVIMKPRVYLNLMTNKIKKVTDCVYWKDVFFLTEADMYIYFLRQALKGQTHITHIHRAKALHKLCPNSVYDNCFLLHSAPALISVSFKLIFCQNRVVQYLTGKFQRQSFNLSRFFNA